MAAYFTAPETQSMHSTGGAVDALIYDMRHKRVMDFGTNDGLVINLSRRCYPDHPDLTPKAKKNRRILIRPFEEEGFVCDLQEFWHFDYGNVVWAIQKNEACAIYDCIEAY
jgi:D-alanyl-D-alanine dipeptidase